MVALLLFASLILADNGGSVYRADWTFLALREDGRGISFGSNSALSFLEKTLVGVIAVTSCHHASTVLLNTSEIVVFGDVQHAGLRPIYVPATGVASVVSSSHAFAALYLDGSVRAWGLKRYGGTQSLSVCSSETECDEGIAPLENVRDVQQARRGKSSRTPMRPKRALVPIFCGSRYTVQKLR